MKSLIPTALIIAGLSVVPLSLKAQDYRVTAQVPFAFNVDGSNMPSGNYVMRSQTSDVDTVAIPQLWNLDTRHSVLLPVTSLTRSSGAYVDNTEGPNAKFVFLKFNGQYYLTEVWPANAEGSRIPLPRNVRESIAHAAPDQVSMIVVRAAIAG